MRKELEPKLIFKMRMIKRLVQGVQVYAENCSKYN